MSNRTGVVAREKASKRVQNNEAMMWQGIRTGESGNTVNRLNKTGGDYKAASAFDRQKEGTGTTQTSAQRSPRQFHMPVISGSQNTNVRSHQERQVTEPNFSESQYRTIDVDRDAATSSKKASRKKLKTIDYSNISIDMLKA